MKSANKLDKKKIKLKSDRKREDKIYKKDLKNINKISHTLPSSNINLANTKIIGTNKNRKNNNTAHNSRKK